MNRLSSPDGICASCGHDNRIRENSDAGLPFSLIAGKYLIGHALGRGGFGITYVGMNRMIGKRVAVKEYFPAEIAERDPDGVNIRAVSREAEIQFEDGKQKALEEARTVARLQSVSNVVSIYDCFDCNNTVYIIMEFIEGETFAAFSGRKGPVKWKDLWPMIRPVGTALGKLHRQNLVHRDISPDNIMIRRDNGESVLLDFGAASGIVAEGQENRTALKDGYAAAEQYQSRAGINGRADEYSWCATVWYMLTGSRPPNALQRKAQQSDPEMPGRIRRRVPEPVRKALLKGMAVLQEDRYPCMEDLIRDLDCADTSSAPRRKLLAALAILALAVLLISLAVGLFGFLV